MELLKKRPIHVVLGNVEENLNDLFTELIKEVVKDKYDLKIKSVFYGEELMKIEENNDVDIFIVVINNIILRGPYPPKERIEKCVQLIAQIKKAYVMSVIALSPAFLESVKQTGVDFYFPLPFNFDLFKVAIGKCIR